MVRVRVGVRVGVRVVAGGGVEPSAGVGVGARVRAVERRTVGNVEAAVRARAKGEGIASDEKQ